MRTTVIPLRRERLERGGMPCFDLLMGMLLWGMRNSRADEADEGAEVIALPR